MRTVDTAALMFDFQIAHWGEERMSASQVCFVHANAASICGFGGRTNKWVMGKKAREQAAHLPSQGTDGRTDRGRDQNRKEGNPANGPMHGLWSMVAVAVGHRNRLLILSLLTREIGGLHGDWRPLPFLETLCCDLRAWACPGSHCASQHPTLSSILCI